jgi:Icc-related predicted phosphoesterase
MPSTVLFVTDIHGAVKLLDALPPADLLLLGGDLTHFGSVAQAERVLRQFQDRFANVFAVSGNCDAAGTDEMMATLGCDLHLRVRNAGELRLCGIGGCNKTPFATPNEWVEEEMGDRLQSLAKELAGESEPIILVSHAPPLGSGAGRLPNGADVGSQAVADFVRTVRPALVLCGHIHEAAGMFSLAGRPVVNPGPFSVGSFARFDTTDLAPSIHRLGV